MCDVCRQQHVSLRWSLGWRLGGAGVANDVSSPPPQTVGVTQGSVALRSEPVEVEEPVGRAGETI